MRSPGRRWWFLPASTPVSSAITSAESPDPVPGIGPFRSPVFAYPAWLPRVLMIALAVTLTAVLIMLGVLALKQVPRVWHNLTAAAPAPPVGTTPLLDITRGEGGYLALAHGGGAPSLDGLAAIAALPAPVGGDLLALQTACARCQPTYQLLDAQGAEVRNLGTAPAAGVMQAAWSRDGRSIAFVEQGLDAARPTVYLFDTLTGVRRPAAPSDPATQSWPAWSPDGQWIAYLSGDQTVVTVVNVATGASRVLNDQLPGSTSLSWSSGGLYIAALHAGGVWLVDVDDGHGFSLDAPGRIAQLGGWSPTGSALSAVLEDPVLGDRNGTSVAVLATGAPPIVLSRGTLSSTPVWSPDGKQLGWIDSEANSWSLWQAPAIGGTAVRTAHGAGNASLLGWR